ncbi:hypothetical protein I9018_20375 [Pseudomonas sp. MPFS]|nr:hypothetical protein [Pseudomonas sp. MPFS]UMZ09853.1 hypothetical protein I9018_20375 [Pseudomonas sp. MPFS]
MDDKQSPVLIQVDRVDDFREKTGVVWYYANIHQSLDDDADETLLNGWLD